MSEQAVLGGAIADTSHVDIPRSYDDGVAESDDAASVRAVEAVLAAYEIGDDAPPDRGILLGVVG